MKIEEILKTVKDKKIQFIRLWFVDILGQVKSFSISPRQLEHGLKDGMGFDGSSVEGFARIYESDLIAKPNPETFQILPWRPKESGVAPIASRYSDCTTARLAAASSAAVSWREAMKP